MWHKFWQILGMEESVVLKTIEAQQAVKALNLRQKDLKYLKKKFEEVDVDGSGTIDSVEFFDMLGEERTPLTDQLFSLMDLDGNGTIEFDEFVAVLLTYCMRAPRVLPRNLPSRARDDARRRLVLPASDVISRAVSQVLEGRHLAVLLRHV